MMTQNYFGVGYCDEDDYLAKTSERVGSKKVDVELKIAWGKTFHLQFRLIQMNLSASNIGKACAKSI